MKHLEDDLQASCFLWFSYQYPELKGLLFAIPNGGRRNVREAARLKRGGVVAGVSDMILLIAKHPYNSLCIEFKAGDGKQTANQINWQSIAESHDNKYVIVRSVDEFMNEIEEFLK